MEHKYRLERHKQRESKSFGYHLCESQFGLIDEMSQARWCDIMCDSPDTIDIRSDTVKYALGWRSQYDRLTGHTGCAYYNVPIGGLYVAETPLARKIV